jgi:hypothetical protein
MKPNCLVIHIFNNFILTKSNCFFNSHYLHLIILLSYCAVNSQAQNMTSTAGATTTITTCSATIQDNGGTGNYSTTAGNFTQIICPTSASNSVHLTMNINLSTGGGPSNDDYLWLFNGSASVTGGTGGTITQSGGVQAFASGSDYIGTYEFYGAPGQCITLVFQQNGAGVNTGWSGTIDCVNTTNSVSSGGNISTCSGLFTDGGGINGNPNGVFSSSGGLGYYTNSLNTTYVFCPSTPGNYVNLNFSEFNVDYDKMIILNGNGPASPIIGQYNLTNSPGSITSSASNGCLTVIFQSDANFTCPGWIASISCVSNPGYPSSVCSTTNCNGGCGYTVCSSGNITVNGGTGSGIQELLSNSAKGCALNGEVNSTWYYFKPQTAGNLGFTITPPSGLDYDYAIWGPYNNYIGCPMSTGDAPIRCSYADANGALGLIDGAGDYSEGVGGNNFTEDLDVSANQVYVLLINAFTNSNSTPTLTWSGTAASSLSCAVPLPAELASFNGYHSENSNILHWQTDSEYNNDFFKLERSQDGYSWEVISTIDGAGFSNESTKYVYRDETYHKGLNYYRLSQTDWDGTTKNLGIISLQTELNNSQIFSDAFPNPSKTSIYINYSGRNFEDEIHIQVFDQFGHILLSEKHDQFNNNQSLILSVEGLSNGIYSLVTSQGTDIRIQKIAKY